MKRSNLNLALRAQRVRAARIESGPRVNPIALVVKNSGRLSPAEVRAELLPMARAHDAMRKATSTRLDWLLLCTAVNHATAMSDMGIVKVPGNQLQAAEDVLTNIEQQCQRTDGTWAPTALRHNELSALTDLLNIYSVMVREVYRNEWTEVQRKAIARVESAGGDVLTVVEVVNG